MSFSYFEGSLIPPLHHYPCSEWYSPTTVSCVVIQLPSRVRLFVTPWTAHAKFLCPSVSLGVCSDSRPLSQWCYLIISSSAVPFSFCLQSFPTSGSFLVRWLLALGGQSIGASASATVFSMNIQGWFPLGSNSFVSTKNPACANRYQISDVPQLRRGRAK